MTSKDNYITIEIFTARMDRFEAIIDKKLTEVKSEIQVVDARINNMGERIEDLKFFGTIGFTAIAIFIAILALIPFARREKIESKPEWTERDLRALIREEISMASSVTNISR